MLKSNPAAKEWLYFAFRRGKPLFKGIPTSIHGWKERFFFVSSGPQWGFNPVWGVPRLKENNLLPDFTDAEKKALEALRGLEGGTCLADLINEEVLVNVGLSPAAPEEIAGMVFDNETLLARYKKRAAEAEGSRVQPRSKKARLPPHPAGGNQTSRGAVGPAGAQKNKAPKDVAPISARCSAENAGTQGLRIHLHQGDPASGSEVEIPTSGGSAPRGATFGVTLSSGAANPPSSSATRPSSSSGAHPPSSSGADPPSSSRVAIGSGEGGPYDPEWSLCYTDSALEDGRVAREIVRGASLPVDRAILKVGPFRDFVDQTYCSAVRHLHEVDMMAEAVSSMWTKTQASDEKLQALTKDLGEAQDRLKEAEGKAKTVSSELDHANERLREIESEYALCQSALRSTEAQAADLMSELKGKGREIDILKLKLRQADEREKKAVELANTAVENFRQSAEYQDELAEEAVDGLVRGFEDFRAQAARLCPKIDFRRLQPRLGSDDDQDSAWMDELEDITFEVIPPTSTEVASETAAEVAPEVVSEAAAEVATVAGSEAAPEVVSEVVPVIDPDVGPSIVHVGDED